MLTNSSMLSEEQEDEELRCPSCFFYFSSITKPYLLPCNHNLCLDCINNLVNLNNTFCPICNNFFPSQEKNNFQVNFAFLNLVLKILKTKIIFCKKCNKIFTWNDHHLQCNQKEFKETNEIMNEIKKLCENCLQILKFIDHHKNIVPTTKNGVYQVLGEIIKEIGERNKKNFTSAIELFFSNVIDFNIDKVTNEIVSFLEMCKPCYTSFNINIDELNLVLSNCLPENDNFAPVFQKQKTSDDINIQQHRFKDIEHKKFKDNLFLSTEVRSSKSPMPFGRKRININENNSNNRYNDQNLRIIESCESLDKSNDIIDNFDEDDIPNEKENDINERLKINTFQNPRVNQFEKKTFDNIINTNNASENFPQNYTFDISDLLDDYNLLNDKSEKKKQNKIIISNKGIQVISNDNFSENVLITNENEIEYKTSQQVKTLDKYNKKLLFSRNNQDKEKHFHYTSNYESNTTILEEHYDIKNPYSGTPLFPIQKLNQQSYQNKGNNSEKRNKTSKNVSKIMHSHKKEESENQIRSNKTFQCYDSVNLSELKGKNDNISQINKVIKNFNKIKDVIVKLKLYRQEITLISEKIEEQISVNKEIIKNDIIQDYNLLLKDISHAYIQTHKRYIINFIENSKKVRLYDVKRKVFEFKFLDFLKYSFNSSSSIAFDDCDLIFISGGVYYNKISDMLQIIRWTNAKIEINETIPTKRAYHSSIYFQNKIYLIGGIGEGNYYLRECENYSIITHKWEFMPFLNYPRANPTLCIYNNSFIYVFRGSDKDSMLDTIEFLGLKNYNAGWTVYQPEDPGLSWFGCEFSGATSIDENSIMIFGGMDKTGKMYHHSFIFDPVKKTVFRTKDLAKGAGFRESATYLQNEVIALDFKNESRNRETKGIHSFSLINNNWGIV